MTELVAREPTANDKVFKEECAYCFCTPQDQDGLFVCLSKFVGLCKKHLDGYAKRSGSKVFLNVKQQKVQAETAEELEQKVKRLQVKGVEIKPKHIETYTVHFAPDLPTPIPYTESALGTELFNICRAVIIHNPASVQYRLEERVFDSPLAQNLVQVHVNKEFAYEGWTCEEPGCDRTENLWLNLSDGAIMCGRYGRSSGRFAKQQNLLWDCARGSFSIVYGDPSKGKGHSEMHARKTGFPLAVKLETIQPDGTADVYHYNFNDKGENIGRTVNDPHLAVHLAHFGLDISRFERHEKTSLELDFRYNFEYKVYQEEGANLETAYGPGLTGLVNFGSSCYINSVMQMLLAVPDFVHAYLIAERAFFESMDALEGQEDFNWQMLKLLHGMASGDHSKRDSSSNGIRPSQFRRIVGRGHAEFSTAKQQDAEEFIRHLFSEIDENPIDQGMDPVRPFRFHTVTRLVDNASGRVRYATCDSDEVVLGVPVPMEYAKKIPVKEREPSGDPNEPQIVRKSVSLSNCLKTLFGEAEIEGYVSPITHKPNGARQTLRMGSFPKFLILQIKRFFLKGLELKKLDVNVEMDDVLDLEAFRSQGLQPGEIELPGSKPTSSGTRGVTNGPGKYRLRGFITHMGKTVHSGHYVAHIKKHDVWYIFNDEIVAVSKRPPKAYGYLYLYERI